MAGGWRLAKSLTTLRNQVNTAYPKRSRISDGAIGDTAHSNTASDHNPNRNGVVCALDLTHDPKNGLDAHKLADHIRVNRHPNLKYIISNSRICSAATNWGWVRYNGSNPHSQHVHFSVGNNGDGGSTSNYDSSQSWDINYKGGSNVQKLTNKNHLTVLFLQFVNRKPTATEVKDYMAKGTLDYALNKLHPARKDLGRVLKQLDEVKKALANEQARPPKEVVKQVEKIVEKEVYIDRPVGEEEAVRGFFGRLLDLIFKK